jgi:hypothetical protein
MALKMQGRLLVTIVAVALFLSLGATLGWGQAKDTWEKLEGKWCDSDQGCTHWWNAYEVEVRGNHVITIRHRDRRFILFTGTIEKPGERWKIDGEWTSGPHKGQKFEAAVSEADDLREIVQGKIKGSLTAKIQAADIEGIRMQEISGVTISGAEIDRPKIDRPKIDEANVSKVTVDHSILGAERLEAEKLEAKNLEAKRITAKKIQGKRIEGGRQVEISIPIQISDATIEGIAKPREDKGKKEDGAEDDEEGRGKKRMELKGKIKGKMGTSNGPGDLKGDFTGTFTAVIQAVIKGSYRVPPPSCSEAGRARSEEEFEALKILFFQAEPRRRETYEALRKRGPERPDELLLDIFAKVEGQRTRLPGRSRWQKEMMEPLPPKEKVIKEGIELCGISEACLVVEATGTKVPRPSEPNTRGRFTRQVSGTVNAMKPRTITIELPPLPMLDHKCSVIDELPKRTLKLVKQHDHDEDE